MNDLTRQEMLIDLLLDWTGPMDNAINMIAKEAKEKNIDIDDYIYIKYIQLLLNK